MEALFGHLCSAKTFVHDQEMRMYRNDNYNAEQKSPFSDITDTYITDLSSNQLTESGDSDKSSHSAIKGQGTVNEMKPVLRRSQRHPVKRLKSSSMLKDTGKKPNSNESAFATDTSTNTSLRRRLRVIKKSFDVEHHTGVRHTIPPTTRSTLTSPVDSALASGTLSDSDVEYETALDTVGSPSDHEVGTQLSLSDSAFDSQQSKRGQRVNSTAKMKNRKEAYKAAKGVDGRHWAAYSPMSSNPSYFEEELG